MKEPGWGVMEGIGVMWGDGGWGGGRGCLPPRGGGGARVEGADGARWRWVGLLSHPGGPPLDVSHPTARGTTSASGGFRPPFPPSTSPHTKLPRGQQGHGGVWQGRRGQARLGGEEHPRPTGASPGGGPGRWPSGGRAGRRGFGPARPLG